MTAQDIQWMRAALALARRGEGLTRPNPPVGAIVVKGGRAVGQGYHTRAGKAHAEVKALQAAGADARGGVLYVTLEPCSTWGRTGPCTEAVRAAGIRRVVAATVDPNPAHRGRGLAALRRAGIAVTCGVLEDQAQALLTPFAKWITTGRPYVTLKLALTTDGRIADARGKARWISSAPARHRVQMLRSGVDAVLVGVGTVLADDPALTSRLRPSRHPLRVVVDTRGRTPLTARLLRDDQTPQAVVATTSVCPARRQAAYRRRGAQVWVLPAKQARVSLSRLMQQLGRAGCLHVLCEGGGELAGALLRDRCVDRLILFIAPKLLGGTGHPAFGKTGWLLGRAPELEFSGCEKVGPDLLITARPHAQSNRRRTSPCLPD